MSNRRFLGILTENVKAELLNSLLNKKDENASKISNLFSNNDDE